MTFDTTAPASRTVFVRVPGMCCPAESGQIERALSGNPDVLSLSFDLAERLVRIETAADALDTAWITAAIEALGMSAEVLEQTSQSEVTLNVENMLTDADAQAVLAIIGLDAAVDRRLRAVRFSVVSDRVAGIVEKLEAEGWKTSVTSLGRAGIEPAKVVIPWARLGAALVLAGAAETLELLETFPEWAVIGCAAAAIALSGFGTIVKGFKSLLRLVFNMTALMSVAVVGACFLGAWPEAAMVMVLYEIGEAIEDLSMVRAKNAIRSLLDVTPQTVLVRSGGAFRKMPVEAVPAGSIYRIEPGERAALDGVVVEGAGSMDESMMTGESLPVGKEPGSRVYAGALAVESTLTIRATAPASDSMSARIIRSVEEAEQKKAPLQRFVDRFAARYTPTVFALALATALIGPWASPLPWTEWVYRALVLLVISCPCALVISTPVTIVSALSLAARRGILIKGGVYLEEGRKLVNVALDKTGTVTRGKPAFAQETRMGVPAQDTLQLAASLAAMSSHPVSRAIAEKARSDGTALLPVSGFMAIPGCGTEGTINGVRLRLTNLRWLEKKGLATEDVRRAFEAAYDSGMSAAALSDMFGVLSVIAVADTVKPNAREAIASMKAAGLAPWLLTGDNARSAAVIAKACGIDNVCAELLPEQKLAKIEELQGRGPTAMAGDGINDAPALSAAHIGFAMGIRGSDSALQAADAALMDDNIAKIAWFKRLSELTHRTLVQNIVFALTVKFGFAAAALAGHASMWAAVFADTGVCLIVVAWGMRLMRAGHRVDRAAGF